MKDKPMRAHFHSFRRLCAGAAIVASLATASHASPTSIHLQDAWARFSPIEGRPAGVYLTIHAGKTADRLISAATPIAARAELHTHTMTGSVMQMRKIDGIDLAASSEVMLKPGGLHIMLFDIKARPKDGSTFPLTLTFAKAGKQTVQVIARPIGAAAPKPADSHSGHQH
jgi:periplasmic copper chaperone A